MQKIGIYGGTFNPPHIGHLRLAQSALQTLHLDKILMIPDRIAPHKSMPAVTPSAIQRFEMLQCMVKGQPNLEVSDLELRREGPSYSYQTVALIRKQYPDAELYLLIGSDMLLTFQKWKESDLIAKQVTICAFLRGIKGEKDAVVAEKKKLEADGVRVKLIENSVTQISSSDLRRMLVFRCADTFLTPNVSDYIHKNGLYGTARNYRKLTTGELEASVIALLKESRVPHVLGCAQTCVELARLYGVNEEDARRAGLLHDITKALDEPLQLTLCQEYGMILDKFYAQNPKTLHALTGSLVAKEIFGENKSVVEAIRCHTTGKADMNLLEKIVYVADYMEPNRVFPGVEELRNLAFSDINKALKLGLTMTLDMLRQQQRQVSPESIQALAYLERNGV